MAKSKNNYDEISEHFKVGREAISEWENLGAPISRFGPLDLDEIAKWRLKVSTLGKTRTGKPVGDNSGPNGELTNAVPPPPITDGGAVKPIEDGEDKIVRGEVTAEIKNGQIKPEIEAGEIRETSGDSELKEDIEGGEVTSTEAFYQYNTFVEKRKEKEVNVASRIAHVLVAMLGVTILLHYLLVMIVVALWNQDISEKLNELRFVFNTALPVLAGLAGSVVTYYFATEKKD